MLTKADRKTAYVIILLVLFAASSFAAARKGSGSRTTNKKTSSASSKTSSSSRTRNTRSAQKAAPRSAPKQVSRPAPKVTSRPKAQTVRRPAPKVTSRPKAQTVRRPAPKVTSRPKTQPVRSRAPQSTSKPASQSVRKPVSKPLNSVSLSKSNSSKTGSRGYSKSPVTSLRSGKVIQKPTGHSSKLRSTNITASRQRISNRIGGSRAPISTVSPGSRSILSTNRLSVKTGHSSVRLPSVRTESKYVKVIQKKSYGRNDQKKIVVSSGLKSGKLSKISNVSSRISNLPRAPLAKRNSVKVIDVNSGRHSTRSSIVIKRSTHSGKDILVKRKPLNVRESVARVALEKKSISIKNPKNLNIKGNNNIYVKRNYYEAKNYKPARNFRDYRHYAKINHSNGHINCLPGHKWHNYGKIHLLEWSNKSCSRVVYFNYGSRLGVSYIYPSHHRKYLFVSIGGYWPYDYRYRRYYRYGCHPNTWYGSQPYEYPAVDNSVTNNNYYYGANTQPAAQNYYDNSSAGTYGTTYSSSYAGSYGTSLGIPASSPYNAEYEDYSDVRERLAAEQTRQVEEAVEDAPAEESLADIYFDNAVEAFAGGDYKSAIDAVNKAIALAPQDEILPFTLVQSLFAGGRDTEAAMLLRGIFDEMPRDRETLYYPRGLYPDDAVLQKQILALSKKVDNEPADGDLNLLLAYHLLGTGEIDKAAGPLYKAKLHLENEVSVAIMEDLLEEARTNEQIELEGRL